MKARLILVLLSVMAVACSFGTNAQAGKNNKKRNAMLTQGDKAPSVVVKNTTGEDVDLSKVWADGPVILAFFPKAFTGG